MRVRLMQWTVGKVRITQIIEGETIGSTRFILPQVGPDEVHALPWLMPDFATPEGRLKMSIHALVVETPTRRIVVDTVSRQRQAGPFVPTWNNLHTPFLENMTAAGFRARQHRHGAVHPSACRSCRLEYKTGRRQMDADIPQCALCVRARHEYDYWRDASTERRISPCSTIP
jgi:hypothetical protein